MYRITQEPVQYEHYIVMDLTDFSEEVTVSVNTEDNKRYYDEKQQPHDKFKIISCIMILQGLGGILPFNMFTHAYAYFSYKFNGTTASFSDSFESYFSITAMLPILLGSSFAVWLQMRLSIKTRFLASTSMILVLLALNTIFVKVPTDHWVRGFFILTLILLFALNSFSSVYQCSMFGLAGILGRSYVSALMSGQSIAGLFSTIAAIVSASIDPIRSGHCETDVSDSNSENITMVYFLSAVIIMLMCIVSFLFLMKMQFIQHHLHDALNGKSSISAYDETTPMLVKKGGTAQAASILYITYQIWAYAVSVFLIFAVTLSLFPAVLTNIRSISYHSNRPEEHPWSDCLFIPLMCFLVFTTSDLAGRVIPQWIMWPRNKHVILLLTISRLVFIPLLLACNHKGSANEIILFKSDIYPITFNALMGLSNGYLATVCMILAPRCVDSQNTERASTIMSFFLNSGLTTGALLSFIMLTILGVKVF